MRGFAFLVMLMLVGRTGFAQHIAGYNYDEAKVPPYTMLDPLLRLDGKTVTTPEGWWTVRRPEVLRLFEENVFGRTPAAAQGLPVRARVVEEDRAALGWRATRRQVDLFFTDRGVAGLHMRLLVYLPHVSLGKKIPVIVGLNFGGNQTVLSDPAIEPTDIWSHSKGSAELLHPQPAASTRGSQAAEWQVKR